MSHVPKTPELELLVDTAPAPGTRYSLLDGIDWIYQPLPFRLDHVNCWWLDGGDQQRVQIDTGIASDTTRAHWQEALQGERPDTLLITHYHPDHAGLVGDYAREGISVLSSEVEMQLSSRIWHFDPVDYGQLYAGWFRRNGLDQEVVERARAPGNLYQRIFAEPPALHEFSWLAHEQRVDLGGRSWRIMYGRGHAPAMLMLFDEASKLLIAADQVLPRISPNVSVGPSTLDYPAPFGLREPDPLERFLSTLRELQTLPVDTVVLPSHGLPFRGLHARLDELIAHHQERLAQVLDVCSEPRTAADLFAVLFGKKMDAQQMSFALGESLAHADHLVARGELVCDETADVRRYRRA